MNTKILFKSHMQIYHYNFLQMHMDTQRALGQEKIQQVDIVCHKV